MMGWNLGWGWMFGGGIMMLLFWFGLIAVVVLSIQAFSRVSPSTSGRWQGSAGREMTRESPLEILQSRYARGEIGRDEYEKIRSELLRPVEGLTRKGT